MARWQKVSEVKKQLLALGQYDDLDALIKEGRGKFWRTKRGRRGELLIKFFSEQEVARRLGVSLEGQEPVFIPLSALQDGAKFEAYLKEFGDGQNKANHI